MINLYCTYDNISEEFSTPWTAKNDNVARRNLMIAAKRQNLPLEDITLYLLGSFDEDKGFLFDDTQGKLLAFNHKVINLIDDEKNASMAGFDDSKE